VAKVRFSCRLTADIFSMDSSLCRMSVYFYAADCRRSLEKHAEQNVSRSRVYPLIWLWVGHKKRGTVLCPHLRHLMTDFQNFFTDTLCGQFAIMWLLYFPPHRKCVSTLPCKIWMKYACITIIANDHFVQIEKKYFRSTVRWMTQHCVGPNCNTVQCQTDHLPQCCSEVFYLF